MYVLPKRECSWSDHFKSNVDLKNHVRINFPLKDPFFSNSLLQNIRIETMFGYLQYDLSVPVELKAKSSNFLPIFKSIDGAIFGNI